MNIMTVNAYKYKKELSCFPNNVSCTSCYEKFESFWTTKELKLQHIFTYNSYPEPSQYFYS